MREEVTLEPSIALYPGDSQHFPLKSTAMSLFTRSIKTDPNRLDRVARAIGRALLQHFQLSYGTTRMWTGVLPQNKPHQPRRTTWQTSRAPKVSNKNSSGRLSMVPDLLNGSLTKILRNLRVQRRLEIFDGTIAWKIGRTMSKCRSAMCCFTASLIGR